MLLVFLKNENYHGFAKDTCVQIRFSLVFHYFSKKYDDFTLSFASEKSHLLQRNWKIYKFGPKTTLFVRAVTERVITLVRLDNRQYAMTTKPVASQTNIFEDLSVPYRRSDSDFRDSDGQIVQTCNVTEMKLLS